MDYPDGFNVTLVRGRQEDQGKKRPHDDRSRGRHDTGPETRVEAASRSWKRQGNIFFPRVSRRNAALLNHFGL